LNQNQEKIVKIKRKKSKNDEIRYKLIHYINDIFEIDNVALEGLHGYQKEVKRKVDRRNGK
jgi:hypothetical protein